jgi:hypothetical protein
MYSKNPPNGCAKLRKRIRNQRVFVLKWAIALRYVMSHNVTKCIQNNAMLSIAHGFLVIYGTKLSNVEQKLTGFHNR